MGILTIHGGRPLIGEVEISGAKNAVLPLLAATVVRGGRYRLEHCPRLTDVDATMDILRHIGCCCTFDADAIEVDSRCLPCASIPQVLMCRLRSSVVFLGALLSRCGQAALALPGGCPIGARPINLHLDALEQLGAQINCDGAQVTCKAGLFHGGTVMLPYPSVGATENLLLAAMCCPDGVTIVNAAKEPEVGALADFLSQMGAEVSGQGSSVLTLLPPKTGRDTDFQVLPDRMEAATYLCALAACGGALSVTNIEPQLLLPVLHTLEEAGVKIELREHQILASAQGLRGTGHVETAPFPVVPTDAEAPLMAALLRAEGESVLKETVFEQRFRHVEALRRLGADITVQGSVAAIRGVAELRGADMAATDLRGGAAMVIGANSASGVSHNSLIQHIYRVYERLCEKLSALGAQITRSEESLEDI